MGLALGLWMLRAMADWGARLLTLIPRHLVGRELEHEAAGVDTPLVA